MYYVSPCCFVFLLVRSAAEQLCAFTWPELHGKVPPMLLLAVVWHPSLAGTWQPRQRTCRLSLLTAQVPWIFLELPKLRAAAPGEINISPAILFSNAVAAFALNLAVYLLIGKTSALTMNIAGTDVGP
jgi:hypothetical protein